MRKRGKIALLLSIIVALFLLLWVLSWRWHDEPEWGITYSVIYAEELGLDARETYVTILDELEPAYLRIPVYWSRYEVAEQQYSFEELDWMMDEAAARGIDVTLAIGQKVPRWPECFIPAWYDDEMRPEALLDYLEVVVRQYQDHPALLRWQVENEPFFPFGDCPANPHDLLDRERALVRSLDQDRPIQETTSGEQSIWAYHAVTADVLGVSLYQEVSNAVTGPILVPFNPRWYRIQSFMAHLFTDHVIISELQTEPWGIAEYLEEDRALEAYDRFTVEELEAHMTFARQTDLDEVYLWGVEWWYYLKVLGDDRLWESGKMLMQ